MLTLGIRPKHIKLFSQQACGIPLVVETLERLGADNLAHGKWGGSSVLGRLSHVERPALAACCGCFYRQNRYTSLTLNRDNVSND